MADTRRDKRAPLNLKVRFKSATVDDFLEQYGHDISVGGLFIKTKKPMAVGTLLKFELLLKDKTSMVHGVGRVVWHRPLEVATKSEPPGMGIKFVKMDAESRAFVDDIVHRREGAPGRYESEDEDPEAAAAGLPSERPPAPATDAASDAASAAPASPAAAPAAADAPEGDLFGGAGVANEDLPDPEDRTTVRHGSEFLAMALSGEADEATAREAEEGAAVARRGERSIAAEQGEGPEDEAPPAANAPAADAASGPDAQEASAAEDAAPAEKASASDEKPKLAMPDELAASATAPSQAPADEGGGKGMMVAVLLLLLVGGGVAFMMSRGGQDTADGADQGAAPTVAGATDATPTPEPEPEPEPEVAATDEDAGAADEDPADAGAEEAAAEPEEEAVPTVSLRINSTPAGAEIEIAGTAAGAAPTSANVPERGEVVVRATLAGHRPTEQTVRLTGRDKEVRIRLEPLPYVVEVNVTPDSARVRANGRSRVGDGEIEIARPTRTIAVRATASGYDSGSGSLEPEAFVERDGAMRATITLVLEERRALRPATMRDDTSTAPAGTMAETPPATMTDPAPAPAQMTEPAPAAPTMTDPAPSPSPMAEPAPAPTPAPSPMTEPAPAPAPATMHAVPEPPPPTMATAPSITD